MGIKQFKKIDKKGREETWEWEETPEVVAALKQLHATKRLHEDIRRVNEKEF